MSPVSRVRKKEAVAATVAQAKRNTEAQRRAYKRRRTLIRLGQILMIAAAVLAVQHAAAHLGAFGVVAPSTTVDLLFGWPLAAVLFLLGAVLAGQTDTPGRLK